MLRRWSWNKRIWKDMKGLFTFSTTSNHGWNFESFLGGVVAVDNWLVKFSKDFLFIYERFSVPLRRLFALSTIFFLLVLIINFLTHSQRIREKLKEIVWRKSLKMLKDIFYVQVTWITVNKLRNDFCSLFNHW